MNAFLSFIVAYVVVSVLTTYALWVHYLAVMNLQRVRDAKLLTTTAKTVGMFTLVKGYLLDVWVNVTVMSVLLLEVPKELTVTSRLKRHNRAGGRGIAKWRYAVAQWLEPLLDPYDPDGDHI
jgi:hypothetical protein